MNTLTSSALAANLQSTCGLQRSFGKCTVLFFILPVSPQPNLQARGLGKCHLRLFPVTGQVHTAFSGRGAWAAQLSSRDSQRLMNMMTALHPCPPLSSDWAQRGRILSLRALRGSQEGMRYEAQLWLMTHWEQLGGRREPGRSGAGVQA